MLGAHGWRVGTGDTSGHVDKAVADVIEGTWMQRGTVTGGAVERYEVGNNGKGKGQEEEMTI